MNGARLNFLRKGYWLTALATIMLLAAAHGTAQAQVTITGPATVDEGDVVVYEVKVEGLIPAGEGASTFSVTLGGNGTLPADETTPATAGDPADTTEGLGVWVYTVEVPANNQDGAVPAAFNRAGSIRVPTVHDLDAEDEKFTLAFTPVFGGLVDEDDDEIVVATGTPGKLTILDDETQTYELTLDDDDDPKEGGADVTATIKAVPPHDDNILPLTAQLDAPLTTASLDDMNDAIVLNMANADGVDIVIEMGTNDGNRVEDTVTLTLYSGSAGNSTPEETLSFDIEDINALPAVAMMVVDKDGKELDPQPTSVPEGESTMVVVMVVDDDGKAIDAAEDLKVQLMPTGTADSADYTVVGSSDIDMDEGVSTRIEIEVRSDEDVGMESLMFDAVVSGESANGPGTRTSAAVLSLYIEDETAKKITPKATEADYAALMAAIAAGAATRA